MEQKQRILYCDILRVLAMVAVVTIHTTAKGFNSLDITSSSWIICVLYNSMVRWAVPIFVMVSGAVFLNPEKKVSTRELFSKYIPRLALSFLFWSAVYLLLEIYLYHREMDTVATVRRFITGHYHLWYLPMCIGLYMVIPVLKKLADDKKTTVYFLCLAFVFTFAIPSILEIVKLFDERAYDLADLFVNRFYLHLPLGYTAYFLLGDYLNRSEISKKTEYFLYILGSVGALLTLAMTIAGSWRNGKAYTGYLNNCYINVLLESLAVFIFAKKHLNTLRSTSVKTVLLWFSKHSFGIYLTHVFFADLAYKYCRDIILSQPIVVVPASVLVFVVMSAVSSMILKKIPLLNKIS